MSGDQLRRLKELEKDVDRRADSTPIGALTC